MTSKKAILKIPSDRSSVLITGINDGTVYLCGNEDQALRISFCVPPFMGGDMYTISEGALSQRDGVM